ncbi:granulin-like protein [Apostichopus japonicus]|uniref:Granulin-like protein n=1 Tax=Stichopus japonicus TaxID=307972 RepID=A0A2G8KIQ0_STIJA|nr:granulin-like protein [Apostichopus japonicus]
MNPIARALQSTVWYLNISQAVCCSDGEHCCPSGYTCDVSEGTCSSESEKLPWFEKEVAKNVHCGGKYYCKDGNTCCPQADGKYGCCPLPKAECCDTHCCPEGFSCDGDQCSKEEGNVFVAE